MLKIRGNLNLSNNEIINLPKSFKNIIVYGDFDISGNRFRLPKYRWVNGGPLPYLNFNDFIEWCTNNPLLYKKMTMLNVKSR